MHKVTLANGQELLIVQKHEGMLFIHLYGVAISFGQIDGSVVNIDLTDKKHIGTLTVHEDRSISVDFVPNIEYLYPQPNLLPLVSEMLEHEIMSHLPLVNPVPNYHSLGWHPNESPIEDFDARKRQWCEAESKLMKPGKYIVILKQKP